MREDLTGRTFGELTVIRQSESQRKHQRFWLCRCTCGRTSTVSTADLKSGNTKSCGHKKNAHRHGLYGKRIYRIYQSMKQRCYNPRNTNYKNYGGRGIKMCQEWVDSVETFSEWAISNGYADNLEIDRIDVDGDYSPNNCRWISHYEQCQNRRTNVQVTINGVTCTLAEWARKAGITYNTIFFRYSKGVTGEELVKPSRKENNKG